LTAHRRAQRPAQGQDTAAIEYVYSHDFRYPECNAEPYWSTSRYRIHKKTRTRLYVVKDRVWTLTENGPESTGYYQVGDVHLVDTFILDRRRLEAGETIYHYGQHRDYTLSPEPPQRDRECPHYLREALGVLSLSWPCSPDDVKAAYRRLVRERHPDAGGTQEEFVRLHAAYEQATTGLPP
jgi:hypothetical protein